MTNVADKVRNAIKKYQQAVAAVEAERSKLSEAGTEQMAATRELIRQLGNVYPGKSVLYGGRRYGLQELRDSDPGLEVVDSNEIVLD